MTHPASSASSTLHPATAGVGALLHRQRPSTGFWLCAVLGSAMVAVFAVLHGGSAAATSVTAPGISMHGADLLLVAAMLCAAVG